jgi:hypothetical protein
MASRATRVRYVDLVRRVGAGQDQDWAEAVALPASMPAASVSHLHSRQLLARGLAVSDGLRDVDATAMTWSHRAAVRITLMAVSPFGSAMVPLAVDWNTPTISSARLTR